MSEIRLFLLGAPRMERDGSAVDLDTRKAIALVAYLAVEGQNFRRDSLAGLLWPEHGGDQARGALRRTLSTLKKGMGGEGVQADRATVGLTSQAMWTDATEFVAWSNGARFPSRKGTQTLAWHWSSAPSSCIEATSWRGSRCGTAWISRTGSTFSPNPIAGS